MPRELSDWQESGHHPPTLAHEDVVGAAGRPRVHDLDANTAPQGAGLKGDAGENLASTGSNEDDLGF